jgi:hypothetical protein
MEQRAFASFTGSASAARGGDYAQYTPLSCVDVRLDHGSSEDRSAVARTIEEWASASGWLMPSASLSLKSEDPQILSVMGERQAAEIGVCAGSNRLSKSLPCQGVLPAVVGWRSLRRLDLLLSRNGPRGLRRIENAPRPFSGKGGVAFSHPRIGGINILWDPHMMPAQSLNRRDGDGDTKEP